MNVQASLIVLRGAIKGCKEGEAIILDRDIVRICRRGKRPDDIVPDIEIIGDKFVSRTPVEISYDAAEHCFTIRDTGSIGGTFLNGDVLEKDKLYKLAVHDLIGLVKVENEMRILLRFECSKDPDDTIPPWVDGRSVKPRDKGLSINTASKKVFVDGKEIKMSATEFKLLEVLYSNRGKPCTIDDIVFEVWGAKGATDELVAQYILRIRRQIEADPSKPRYIIALPKNYRCYQMNL